MKKITPFKRIDKFVAKKHQFKTIEQAEKHIRRHGTSDYMAVANILYTMEEAEP